MDMHHRDLSISLLLQKETFEDALKEYSPNESIQKILDRHFKQLKKIAEPYYDFNPTTTSTSVSGTPRPFSSYGSVPHTPTTAFGDETMSVSSSRRSDSKVKSRSDTSIIGHKFSTRSVPLGNLHLDVNVITKPNADTAFALDHAVPGDLANGTRGRRATIVSPNDREKSWTIKRENGVENSNQQSIATPCTVRKEQRPLTRTGSRVAQNEQMPRKRRKVGGSNVGNKYTSMFISASDGEDSSEEEVWIYKTGDLDARKRANRIIQEPKILKASQVRRQSTTTENDKDEKKILLDFGAWEQDEIIRKGGIGVLEPEKIYRSLEKSIASDGVVDADSSHTASQIALMVLSLGSTEAIVDLKCIIESMRPVTQAVLLRPPIKVIDRVNLEELDRVKAVKLWKNNLVKLTQSVYESTSRGTPLENFQSRYFGTHLCQFIVAARDQLMQQNGKLNRDDAEDWIYSRLIRKAYPKIMQYRKSQKGADKRETSQFTDAVTTLRNRSQRGFRWLALREKFGVGIMALYYHSGLFSETARISIDDDKVSVEEFNFLMNFLDSEDGKAYSAWLSLLCKRINPHIEQGAEGMLRLPNLFLEKWEAKQITLCREQSTWLSMMCETLADRLRCPGNKVTKAVWLSVDYSTHLADWMKEVEKGVHEKV